VAGTAPGLQDEVGHKWKEPALPPFLNSALFAQSNPVERANTFHTIGTVCIVLAALIVLFIVSWAIMRDKTPRPSTRWAGDGSD
jgi:hypothetical protein